MDDTTLVAASANCRWGLESARTELKRLLTEGILDPLVDHTKFGLIVDEATAPRSERIWRDLQSIGATLAQIPEETLFGLWDSWLTRDCLYLHMLVPAILERCPTPSVRLSLYVLESGIAYPDPSFNRYFIEAAIVKLSLSVVLAEILKRSKSADEGESRRLAAAYYWTFPGPSERSQELFRDHADRDLAEALRLELNMRLRRVAKFLQRNPWWKLW